MDEHPVPPLRPLRRVLLGVAALLCVLTFLPPLSHLATRYELGVLLRYGVWATVIPALVALGAIWPDWAVTSSVVRARARHPELVRAVAFLVIDALIVVWWFTPVAVRATVRNPWLTAVEALTLIVAGTAFWLELVESPPFVPRSGTFRRAVLGAVAMWLLWTEAYLVGMSQSAWYSSFTHVAGRGLSQAADQQVAAMVLWLIATAVFVPLIFVSAMRWLHADPEPEAELRQLLKEDRRGRAFVEPRAAVPRPGPG